MKRLAFLLPALWIFTACAPAASPVMGVIYTDVGWDKETDGTVGAKEGKACAEAFFSLVAKGDASIKAAAAAGGVKKITTVDHHTRNILIYGEYCTIVRGE
ncbi:MAG: TRL-like family protein [Bdellovibrionota bacterium]